jgi:hypothetical protein
MSDPILRPSRGYKWIYGGAIAFLFLGMFIPLAAMKSTFSLWMMTVAFSLVIYPYMIFKIVQGASIELSNEGIAQSIFGKRKFIYWHEATLTHDSGAIIIVKSANKKIEINPYYFSNRTRLKEMLEVAVRKASPGMR